MSLDLDFAAHGSQLHFVIIKWTIQMGIGRYSRGGIGLTEQVGGDLSLRKEFVPKVHREVVSHTSKDAEEMRLEISDCNFGCVSAMAAWRNKFVCHFVCVGDERFHCRGDLIVEDMFAREKSSAVQVSDER
jgi:hypothetical protein